MAPVLRPEDVREHNLTVYREIAEHFAATRERPWEDVSGFIDRIEPLGDPGTFDLLDLGCGNGRHVRYAVERGLRVCGVDNLDTFLEMAAEAAMEVPGDGGDFVGLEGELDELPLDDGEVRHCVCIAALHHLPTRDERLRSVREIDRTLAWGGEALVSVWSLGADRFRNVRERHAANGPDVQGGSKGDSLIPWKRAGDEEVFWRFYHLYSPGELEGEVEEALGRGPSRSWTSGENAFCVFGRA